VSCPHRAISRLIRQLRHTCALEIIILSAWSIWKCGNGWIFENEAPSVGIFRGSLSKELRLLQFRVRADLAEKKLYNGCNQFICNFVCNFFLLFVSLIKHSRVSPSCFS
jgi:hypothetical protein